MELQNKDQTDENPPATTKKTTDKSKLSWWEILKFVLITAAIVLPIRTFIAQPFIVSGASMEPNFHNREYLIVDELSYLLRSPARGEVVIFRYPLDPSVFFIKRVVGLPGETVDIYNGKITITDATDQSFVLTEPYTIGFTTTELNHVKLGPQDYFLAGDHREVSFDSRRFGAVKVGAIRGRAWLRLLPPSELGYLPSDESKLNPQD